MLNEKSYSEIIKRIRDSTPDFCEKDEIKFRFYVPHVSEFLWKSSSDEIIIKQDFNCAISPDEKWLCRFRNKNFYKIISKFDEVLSVGTSGKANFTVYVLEQEALK